MITKRIELRTVTDEIREILAAIELKEAQKELDRYEDLCARHRYDLWNKPPVRDDG